MTIERFTKQEFEAALPKDKVSGAALWETVGLEEGEWTYRMTVREGAAIRIRSSVREGGLAASAGKDSIRAWLTDPTGNPLGSKLQSYVTRVPGWRERLVDILRELWRRGKALRSCPTCGKLMGIYQTKKPGDNEGRLFMKCWDHGHFAWLDELPKANEAPKAPAAPTNGKLVPVDAVKVAEVMATEKTKKGRVELLKDLISTDKQWTVFALLQIYAKQTEVEKAVQATKDKNGVGFSGVHAEILSSFALQFQAKGFLSDKQMAIAQKRLSHYAGQLEQIVC